MGPDDPFLNVEKPINHPSHGLRNVLQRTGQHPVSKVEERLRNEWEEGTGQKLSERSEFFWPGVFVSFFAKKESPRQGMEVQGFFHHFRVFPCTVMLGPALLFQHIKWTTWYL